METEFPSPSSHGMLFFRQSLCFRFSRSFKPSRFQFTARAVHSNANVPAIYKTRKERFITPTMIVLGIIPIFTFALGVWQVQRLKWKVNLIDELEEKLQLPPLSLPRRIK